MAIQWQKSTETRQNPFDGLNETVIRAHSVVDGLGQSRPMETYEFIQTTTDADIEAKIVEDFQRKGIPT